uniref:Uncharacterized protein n=1 Tax=Glossina brevipalpis TaxID=37001 RepID=A0A1A9W8L0_9MUSC
MRNFVLELKAIWKFYHFQAFTRLNAKFLFYFCLNVFSNYFFTRVRKNRRKRVRATFVMDMSSDIMQTLVFLSAELYLPALSLRKPSIGSQFVLFRHSYRDRIIVFVGQSCRDLQRFTVTQNECIYALTHVVGTYQFITLS